MNRLTSFDEFQQFLGQFTNYERQRSFRYDKKTVGLGRMERLLAELGDPTPAERIIHVAGTKGKGSTSLILESLLLASGYSVGTYTSPHVESLRERIRGGSSWESCRSITDQELVSTANQLMPALSSIREQTPDLFPSFFELMTAVAVLRFREWQIDLAIFEVGLGGRLDATNVVRPRYSIITSIGLEHTQQLGNDVATIAGEKAGIIKAHTPVVIGPMPASAAAAIRRIAEEREAPLTSVSGEEVQPAGPGSLFLSQLQSTIPCGSIVGPALRTDLALALTVYAAILRDDGRDLDVDTIRQAVANARLPARIERIGGSPPVIVDSAHTEESLNALRQALSEDSAAEPPTVVFSLAHDKEVDRILPALRRVSPDVIFTRGDTVRSESPSELQAAFGGGEVIEDPEAAFERAVARGRPVVVTGSFYLAGRLRPLARQHAECRITNK